jgi:DNA-directed RNA polymerase subunit H (RpoH/RPB5)
MDMREISPHRNGNGNGNGNGNTIDIKRRSSTIDVRRSSSNNNIVKRRNSSSNIMITINDTGNNKRRESIIVDNNNSNDDVDRILTAVRIRPQSSDEIDKGDRIVMRIGDTDGEIYAMEPMSEYL